MRKLYNILLCLVPIYFITFLTIMLIWDGQNELILLLGNGISIFGVIIVIVTKYLAYKYSKFKSQKKFWLLLTVGSVFYLIADFIWMYYESILRVEVSIPGAPDLFYISYGLLFITALLILAYRNKGIFSSFQLFLDMVITYSVVITIGWRFLAVPRVLSTDRISLELIISLTYLAISLVLACGYIRIFLGKKITLNQSAGKLFMFGLGLYIISDVYYLYLTFNNAYLDSRWIDSFWVVGLMYVGLAGLRSTLYHSQPTEVEILEIKEGEHPSINILRMLVPYLSVLYLIYVLLVHGGYIDSLLIGLCLIFFLVMVRQVMVLLQNSKLIHSLQEANERLIYLNRYNKLTGLYNRSFFDEELQRLQKSDELPISIMVCDLDGLKIINDTMGHEKGDELLIKCSQIIKSCMGENDILARIGGDEFAAIMPQTHKGRAENIVKLIKKRVIEHNEINKELPISISIGIATSIQSTYLEHLLKEADNEMYNEKLIQKKSSKSQIIDSLMAALEERDHITEGHAQRVAEYCMKIGERMNLSSSTLSKLSLLAQVHDLGKVGIPDSILFKKGPLTEEEWKIMKQHPEKGYRIAVASPDLVNVADLILKHHERWDGSGYPLGLQGKDIPIECRILSVVDSYDAITSKRPYKEAKTSLEAVNEIKRCSGIQFEPSIVDMFIEILQEENKTAGNY